jgi:hypothetical protein
MHSGVWCFPIVSLLAKDMKDIYNHFMQPIFAECEELRTHGLGDWNPFDIPKPGLWQNQKFLPCLEVDKVNIMSMQ